MRVLVAALAAWLVALACAVGPGEAQAQPREVVFAGVAYAGEEATIKERFEHSLGYEKRLKDVGSHPFAQALAAMQKAPAEHLNVTAQPLAELKGRDQALVVSLVLNSETVSVERFGDARKLFIQLRAQALFFDFKSMTAVRSYPLSFAYIDNLRREPTREEIAERVKAVYEGAGGKPGLFGRFAHAVSMARVPAQTPRFLQVTQVNFPAEMVAMLPDYLKGSPQTYQTWAADMVAEAISSRAGVPIIPYAKGYAVGKVMAMKILDGDVYNLTLPSPDYAIEVDFKGLKKVKYGENAVGTSFVYGAFADIRIRDPLAEKSYLNTPIRNAEVKAVPASQTVVDDFPAFHDTLNGMFVKLGDAVAGKGNAWVKAAASAQDIEAQISNTKDLMNLCK